jgi:hypothetical protein
LGRNDLQRVFQATSTEPLLLSFRLSGGFLLVVCFCLELLFSFTLWHGTFGTHIRARESWAASTLSRNLCGELSRVKRHVCTKRVGHLLTAPKQDTSTHGTRSRDTRLSRAHSKPPFLQAPNSKTMAPELHCPICKDGIIIDLDKPREAYHLGIRLLQRV